MHIAVEGCSHGELDIIYNAIEKLEQENNFKIDLLICCGDFQSVRNEKDLKCMAVPMKYMQIQDFHKYYSGEKKAPVLTIFIGGNHEASNYLQELPYGGWVAPNIYYLGYAGIVNFGGIRIGGLSGIYKGHDYMKGHYEKSPYTSSSIRSVYHVRKLEVYRLKQLSNTIDIFLSHDWPRGIYNHGNIKNLLRVKQHFTEEVKSNTLGSVAAEDLLENLRPNYWFSGHLHVKFVAVMKHKDETKEKPSHTKFLALDKCLPRREFLQVLEISPKQESKTPQFTHDLEWLTILRLTNHLLCTNNRLMFMPGPGSKERYIFTPTEEELAKTLELMGDNLEIDASSFVRTGPCFEEPGLPDMNFVEMPEPLPNPQTRSLCSKLGIDDPMDLLVNMKNTSSASSSNFSQSFSDMSTNPDEISLIEDSDRETDFCESSSSQLARDEKSGDFIFEVPISPSIKSIESTFSPIPKRERLSLGKPTNDDSEKLSLPEPTLRFDAVVAENTDDENEVERSPPPTKRNSDDFVQVPEDQNEVERSPPTKRNSDDFVQVPEEPQKTGSKKLKRRNMSFYDSDLS